MKKNKLIYFLAAIGTCTLLAFSIFIFPLIIAATPENRGHETLETEDPYPHEELGQLEERELEKIHLDEKEQSSDSGEQESITQQDTDPVEVIDINAITKEMAIEIVEGLYPKNEIEIRPGEYINIDPAGDVHILSWRPLGARYVSAPDFTAAPIWQIFIHEQLRGTIHYRIPDGHTAESYLAEFQNYRASQLHGCCSVDSIITRSTGSTVIQSESSIETITMVELDAFTGKALGSGFFAFCEHNSNYSLFVENEEPNWDFITDYMESAILPEPESQQYHRIKLP